MVMPFRKRKVDEPRKSEAPAEIDCDALWDRAFSPALEELGYVPIRADFDPGSLIVKDMLERLALADLVVADVSLANANVYYEIGLRHVAKDTHCVLVAADWSRQAFDIDQYRALRYPLRSGEVSEEEAAAIRKLLLESLPELALARTPYHELVARDLEEVRRKGVFREQAARLSALQASLRAVRLMIGDANTRAQRVRELQQAVRGTALAIPEVAIELLFLIRDELGWADAFAFASALPAPTRNLPVIREQALFALAESGDAATAIAGLEQLIEELGATPERLGLIGGRYKRLWRDARKRRVEQGAAHPSLEERQKLEKAIDAYKRGMQLDYNAYYCSSNLPQLLQARGTPEDLAHAAVVDHLVLAACERALALGAADHWLRPTLLGAAFRSGDLNRVRELANQVALEGVARWELKSTLTDLHEAVGRTQDQGRRQALQLVLAELDDLAKQH